MDRCEELANVDLTDFFISCAIIIGLVISYTPQLLRIYNRRTSEGLSPWFILLGATSGTCALANILILPKSRADVSCCAVNDGFSCAAGLLGITQIFVQWGCFFLILLLFLIYFPRPRATSASVDGAISEPENASPTTAVSVVVLAAVHLAVIFFISVIMVARNPQLLQAWANTLGIFAAILASFQYFPQIYTTYRLQHAGSLSIGMMCLQTPGGLFFAYSLGRRFGFAGWSTWIQYIILSCLQGILLFMAVYYEKRDQWNANYNFESHGKCWIARAWPQRQVDTIDTDVVGYSRDQPAAAAGGTSGQVNENTSLLGADAFNGTHGHRVAPMTHGDGTDRSTATSTGSTKAQSSLSKVERSQQQAMR